MNKYRHIKIDEKAEKEKAEKIIRMIESVKSGHLLPKIIGACHSKDAKLRNQFELEMIQYLRAARRDTVFYCTAHIDGLPYYGRKFLKVSYAGGGMNVRYEGNNNMFDASVWFSDRDLLRHRFKKAEDLTTEERTSIFTKRLELFQSSKPQST